MPNPSEPEPEDLNCVHCSCYLAGNECCHCGYVGPAPEDLEDNRWGV